MKMTAKKAYEFSLRENNESYRFLDDLFNKRITNSAKLGMLECRIILDEYIPIKFLGITVGRIVVNELILETIIGEYKEDGYKVNCKLHNEKVAYVIDINWDKRSKDDLSWKQQKNLDCDYN